MEIEEQLDDHPFIPVSHAQAEAILEHTPTPDDPPFGPLEALGIWFASVLLILLVPGFFLLPYLAMQDPPITDPREIV
jgi:hypothetical protein